MFLLTESGTAHQLEQSVHLGAAWFSFSPCYGQSLDCQCGRPQRGCFSTSGSYQVLSGDKPAVHFPPCSTQPTPPLLHLVRHLSFSAAFFERAIGLNKWVLWNGDRGLQVVRDSALTRRAWTFPGLQFYDLHAARLAHSLTSSAL